MDLLIWLVAVIIGLVISYWLIHLAVLGALRDHTRWIERRAQEKLRS